MNLEQFKKKIKKSLIVETLRSIKYHPKTILYIILVDVLFLTAVYFLNFLFNTIFSSDVLFSYKPTALVVLILLLTVLNFLLVILIYSFFKLITIKLIKSIFGKNKINIISLKNFYILNLLLFGIPFIAYFILIGLLLILIQEQYLTLFGSVIIIIFASYLYLFVNISHSLFISKVKLGKTIKEANRLTFKPLNFLPLIIISILFLITYYVVYIFLSLILQVTIFSSETLTTRFLSSYYLIVSITIYIAIYVIFSFSRIYLYNLTTKIIRR